MKITTSLFPLCAALGIAAASSVSAAVIYTEDFATATATSISTFSWTAYQDNGTNLTTNTADPFYVATFGGGQVYIGSGPNGNYPYTNAEFAMISNAGTIDPTAYENDLTISFTRRSTDDSTQEAATMGWRVLAQVGSTIYASDFFSRTTTSTTTNVTVSDAVWRVWTGETDLSDGFDIADITGGPTGGNLAAGNISNIGIMALDGSTANDRMRLENFSITGTAVPEPSAALLGGLGLLALFRRRRS
jgi:hypothetical protein